MKKKLDVIHYKNSPFPELQGKLPHTQKTSRNSCHQSNTSNPKLTFLFINTDICIIFKSAWGSIISKRTRINAGRSGVQFLTGAIELTVLQNFQTSPSTHPAPNSSFSSGSKLASSDSLTTHISLDPILKISGAIPPLNLSPSMVHNGTTKFYLNLLPMYISLNRSHSFPSYKGTLSIHYLPLYAHYMTHLFHLHWSNYINIMNSSNNETQYILLCVFLLLSPSIGQIFSW